MTMTILPLAVDVLIVVIFIGMWVVFTLLPLFVIGGRGR